MYTGFKYCVHISRFDEIKELKVAPVTENGMICICCH